LKFFLEWYLIKLYGLFLIPSLHPRDPRKSRKRLSPIFEASGNGLDPLAEVEESLELADRVMEEPLDENTFEKEVLTSERCTGEEEAAFCGEREAIITTKANCPSGAFIL